MTQTIVYIRAITFNHWLTYIRWLENTSQISGRLRWLLQGVVGMLIVKPPSTWWVSLAKLETKKRWTEKMMCLNRNLLLLNCIIIIIRVWIQKMILSINSELCISIQEQQIILVVWTAKLDRVETQITTNTHHVNSNLDNQIQNPHSSVTHIYL